MVNAHAVVERELLDVLEDVELLVDKLVLVLVNVEVGVLVEDG